MRKLVAFLALTVSLLSGPSWAEDFLGLALPPQSSAVKSSPDMVELTTALPPEQVRDFYAKLMEGEKDVRLREWAGSHIVEDFGNKPWNKVIISRDGSTQTKVLITKDSWGWIVGMLSLRLAGVFVVLFTLYLATTLATGLLRRAVKEHTKEMV